MRYVVLCVAVALAGCAKPPDEEPPPPPPAEDACTVEVQESHVPQDPLNLGMLEEMRKSDDPLKRDLANGRFRYGSKLSELTAAYPPKFVLNFGDYATAVYAHGGFDGFSVTARNGRLVCAGFASCTVWATFFDGLSDEQRNEWRDGYDEAFRAHFNLPLPAPPAPAPPADDGIPPPRPAGAKP